MVPRRVVVILLAAVLVSCQPEQRPEAVEIETLAPQPAETTQSAVPSAVPSLTPAVPTPTSGSTASSTPEKQPPNCPDRTGSLVKISLRTDQLSEPLTGMVYLPPCYGTQSSRDYPVLYLLHGILETEDQWLQIGLPEKADRLITEGEIPPLIVVMPRENTWELPPENPYGKVVVEELIPWMSEHYHTNSAKEFRAVGGVSRGGNWALRIGLMHWDTFGAVGVHSAPLFFGDQRRITGWLNEIPEDEFPGIYLDTGEDDQQGDLTREIEQILTREDVVHSWHLFPGTHDLAYWSSHLEDYLRWYSSTWGE